MYIRIFLNLYRLHVYENIHALIKINGYNNRAIYSTLNFVMTLYIYREKKYYDKDFNPGDEPGLYPFWAASVVGPVLHLLAAAHALLFPAILRGVPGSIVGSIVSKAMAK